jgi:hypothetical protein
MARGSEEEKLERLFPRGDPRQEEYIERLLGTATTSPSKNFPGSRAAILPILGKRVGPQLEKAAQHQAGRPGASIEGILANLGTTSGNELARELAGIQQEIKRVRLGIPEAPSSGEAALEGAIEGGAAGGLPGAGLGALGGLISAGKEQEAEGRAKYETMSAQFEASPGKVAERMEEQEPFAREIALTSGEGARRQQMIEGLVTETGLRDTSLGTLASIAAGVQVPLLEVEQTFRDAMGETVDQVERHLGRAINTRTEPDRIAQALEALSTAYLMRGGRGKTGGGTVEGEELNPLSGLGNLFPTKEDPDSPIDTGVF